VVAFVKMMMDKGRSVLNPSAPWMVVLAHSWNKIAIDPVV
jgi:hypothetical protein